MAQQTIGIGAAPNDGTGDPLRTAYDKCNDNFTELYAGLTGLLDFKGSTDCSANPNYPAASKGDYYLVSVAGKIGGASGVVVSAGDSFFALADNAGGTQAGVGTSWAVVEGNLGFTPVNKAGDTMTGDLIVPDEAYDATGWNGNLEVPTKNAVRDKVEAIIAGSATVSDTAYGVGWDGDTTNAPSKNAVYDKIETLTSGSVTAWKDVVRCATTTAKTLATDVENGDTVDGVTLVTGDRVLIKDQAAPAENGIYVVNSSGAPTRASDANSGAELVGALVPVSEGTVNADRVYQCTTNATITVGTTGLTFRRFGSFAIGAVVPFGFFNEGVTGTLNVNSTSYIQITAHAIWYDVDTMPFTEYRVVWRGQSNAAGQTCSFKMHTGGGTELATGDDITFTNGANNTVDSGWKAITASLSGLQQLNLYMKGSNATVDMTYTTPYYVYFR